MLGDRAGRGGAGRKSSSFVRREPDNRPARRLDADKEDTHDYTRFNANDRRIHVGMRNYTGGCSTKSGYAANATTAIPRGRHDGAGDDGPGDDGGRHDGRRNDARGHDGSWY